MSKERFLGRHNELNSLNKLIKKKSASLVVVRGRRRIGKSRLIDEFGENYTYYRLVGIPPTPATTAQSQRNEFACQMSQVTGLPELIADDWSKLLLLLAEKLKTGRVVVLFDEISWMGSKDPDFLGKIKLAWDNQFKHNPQLILILCGSASHWIDKNILSSTGFVGRFSLKLTLHELPVDECSHFWSDQNGYIAAYEKLKVLSITGGVPRYLEEIKPALSAEENIKDLCFDSSGILVTDFDDIFSDLFSKRSKIYKKIVRILVNGAAELKSICSALGVKQTGLISDYLNDLVNSGFVSRDYTWHIKSGEDSRLSHFRLSDNYLRFYLKYIDNNKTKILNGTYQLKSVSALPNWDDIMALQFENLVLNNRKLIKMKLNIKPDEVIADNPYFQRKTVKQSGCQIDYLIQTRFNTLYLCEIRFAKHPVGVNVIDAVKQKLTGINRPKEFSLRPVLIHANGVSEDLVDADYFANIIDFSEFLH